MQFGFWVQPRKRNKVFHKGIGDISNTSSGLLDPLGPRIHWKQVRVFSSLESNWEWKVDRRWAWVKVEVHQCDGMVRNVDLVFGNKIWHQNVDYWYFLFRYYSCNEVGHL
jgi:hypothetical protein